MLKGEPEAKVTMKAISTGVYQVSGGGNYSTVDPLIFICSNTILIS